jgi:hypothetical protein
MTNAHPHTPQNKTSINRREVIIWNRTYLTTMQWDEIFLYDRKGSVATGQHLPQVNRCKYGNEK